MEQGSEAWLAWRRQGLGASEIAAVIGVCKYSTAYQVWLEKTGRSKGFAGNYATQRGSELEAKARSRYELVMMEDMPAARAVLPTYEICRVSLDGLRADRKLILEIKCPGYESHSIALSGKVPDHYLPQVQYQLAVTGADTCHYFSYSDADQSHALVEVHADIAYQGMLIAKALEFWELVKSDTPPPLSDKDVKVIDNNEAILDLCTKILIGKDSLPKDKINEFKARAIEIAGHPKMRCGRVQISSVNRGGKFSFHKLTIAEEAV